MNNFTMRYTILDSERDLLKMLEQAEEWVKSTLAEHVPTKCDPRISIDSRSMNRALSHSRAQEFVAATIEYAPNSEHKVMRVCVLNLPSVSSSDIEGDTEEVSTNDEEPT